MTVQAVLDTNQARVNITYDGQNGDLPDPVSFDATDGDVKGWIAEALRTGGVPGIPAQARADLADFVVDRFAATEVRPYNLLQLRPKTPFGQMLPKVAAPSHLVYACRHCGYEVGSWIRCLCDKSSHAPQLCPACGCPSAQPLNKE